MPLSDLARLVDELVQRNERLHRENARLRRKCNRLLGHVRDLRVAAPRKALTSRYGVYADDVRL